MSARLPLLAVLAVVAFAGAAVGCGRSGARLRDAASGDLNCPPSRLHILGASRTKDVNGCGHTATYVYEDGDWIMTIRDGQMVSAVPAGAAPAKAGPPPVSTAQPASNQPANAVTGTPSMPPSSPPPPAAGGKSL